MFPTFDILGKTISSYSVMAILGMLAAGFYACRAARKRLPDYVDSLFLLLIASIGVFLVGHI